MYPIQSLELWDDCFGQEFMKHKWNRKWISKPQQRFIQTKMWLIFFPHTSRWGTHCGERFGRIQFVYFCIWANWEWEDLHYARWPSRRSSLHAILGATPFVPDTRVFWIRSTICWVRVYVLKQRSGLFQPLLHTNLVPEGAIIGGLQHQSIGFYPCDADWWHVLQAGLTPRVIKHLFASMAAHVNGSFDVRCSLLEIYNETITDLLWPDATNLQVREDNKNGTYVEGLTEEPICSGITFI